MAVEPPLWRIGEEQDRRCHGTSRRINRL